MSLLRKLAVLVVLSWEALADDSTLCESFGMDFQDKGSYFQNNQSTDPFTFVSQFKGCQPDVALNLFVDPFGEQIQCSDTNLTPDNTDQLSTCPLLKNQLFDGLWSAVIISNNGDAEPIAYQRDFSLSVGPQQTSTFTPTVTLTSTVTPVYNLTTTVVETASTTLPQVTVTKPSKVFSPTITKTPKAVTSTTFLTTRTRTVTKATLSVVKVTSVVTASCKKPRRQPNHDPTCRIVPTINGIVAAALSTSVPKAVTSVIRPSTFRSRRIQVRDLEDVDRFIRERAARFVEVRETTIVRRAPDANPLVVTETDDTLYPTSTITVNGETFTNTVTTESLTTTTVTPNPATLTVYNGVSAVPPVTVTLPTPTKMRTRKVVAITTAWRTQTTRVTIKTTTTPPAVYTSCMRAGGILT